MPTATDWLAVILSFIALGLSVYTWIQSRRDAKRQARAAARGAVDVVINRWLGSLMSTARANEDPDLKGVKKSVHTLAERAVEEQARANAPTSPQKNLAYYRIGEAVRALKTFEADIEKWVQVSDDWGRLYELDMDWKSKYNEAIDTLQRTMAPIIRQLDRMPLKEFSTPLASSPSLPLDDLPEAPPS